LDLHRQVDGLEEVELGAGRSIGTTKRGIGPTYSNKASRNGLRIADLYTWDIFEERLRRLADGYKKRFGDLFQYDVDADLVKYKACILSALCYFLFYFCLFIQHLYRFWDEMYPSTVICHNYIICIALRGGVGVI
jgi:adenylosuccinate synthase